MTRPADPRARWATLALALLCLLAWVGSAWHLAVESHDHADAAHDEDPAPAAGHPDHDAPAEPHDPHDAGDHLLPAFARPASAALAAPGVTLLCAAPQRAPAEPAPRLAAPPRDVVAPKVDPPPRSRRPRAPPVG